MVYIGGKPHESGGFSQIAKWGKRLPPGRMIIKRKTANGGLSFLEVTPGFEPGNQGFADPCLTTWLCHHLHCIICELSEKVHPFLKKTQKIFPPAGTPTRTKQRGAKPGPRNPAKHPQEMRGGSGGEAKEFPSPLRFRLAAKTPL